MTTNISQYIYNMGMHIMATCKVVSDKLYEYYNKKEDTSCSKRVFESKTYYDQLMSKCTQIASSYSPPTHIIDNIYLGGALNAANLDNLREYEIQKIINVTNEISNYYPDEFKYERYGLNDSDKDDIGKFLDEIYKEMTKEPNANLLIHCYMGASRSACAVIYYLTQKHNMTVDDALKYVKQKREVVDPNVKFMDIIHEKIKNKNKNNNK